MTWFLAGLSAWILLLLACWVWLDGSIAAPRWLRRTHRARIDRPHRSSRQAEGSGTTSKKHPIPTNKTR